MNERSAGALEALAYIKGFIVKAMKSEDPNEALRLTEAELEFLIEALLKGVSIDFKHRISRYC
ncbi:MAG: hypothetical protein QXE79_07115 [Candidatus Bathyarchaeia archaeon]